MSTYFFGATFEEALVDVELIEIDILEHVLDLVVGLTKRLRDVMPRRLLQEDEHDDPICLSPCLQVVLVERRHPEELEDLVFVHILAHVRQDMLLEVVHLNLTRVLAQKPIYLP